MGGQHLQPQQKFICRSINKLQYPWHYTLQKVCTWTSNNLHQSIKFAMEKESNGELEFLDILLKQNKGWYTDDVHEISPIFKTPQPPWLSTSEILSPPLPPPTHLDLGCPISKNPPLINTVHVNEQNQNRQVGR